MALAETLSGFVSPDCGGVSATFNSVTTNVLLDKHDEDVLHGRAESTTYRMTLVATDFPTLKYGSTLVVNGVNYTVHTVSLIDDGAFKVAVLYAT